MTKNPEYGNAQVEL